jgi:hypothetical protein
MSMPSFPPNGANMTREEALTMIIASIAMEELALSHILNAEGEKLQYILGTLPGTKPCAGPDEVLSINKSVTALMEAVTQNQMLLKNKLERVLEVCPPSCWPEPGPHPCPPPCRPEPGPHPCPPPCRPEPGPRPCPPSCGAGTCLKSALQLEGQRADLLWRQGCRLPWRQLVQRGTELHWNEQNPDKVFVSPGKVYVVQYTLNLCTAPSAEETGCIRLGQNPGGAFTEAIPLHFKKENCENQLQTLQYTAVLYPRIGRRGAVELSLILEKPDALHVKQAVMNIAEL